MIFCVTAAWAAGIYAVLFVGSVRWVEETGVLESCVSAFKIGITHDPAHRWQNEVYGYGRVVDGGFRSKRMVVVFISMNADVVAMFEAGLIYVGLRAFGQRCRNKALGGESKGRGHTGGPHFAYVVFAE